MLSALKYLLFISLFYANNLLAQNTRHEANIDISTKGGHWWIWALVILLAIGIIAMVSKFESKTIVYKK